MLPAHWLRGSIVTFVLFLPLFPLYRVLIEWFMCIELPWKTRVGPGLKLHHGQALVVNDATVFGAGCILRSSTTIGNKQQPDGTYSGSPVIGDRVDVGSNAVIFYYLAKLDGIYYRDAASCELCKRGVPLEKTRL